ncbi:methyl-accepting chemotaxis protein [Castellaniella sp.]|uniref:methyl-accepting chemotaxis protein n=1 Tax=Castellaniella sp. TaxID=1955812 RepID=UPI002AFE013F|nr:methyl-accepting chemotaxis protein [Castellaniella sp.]
MFKTTQARFTALIIGFFILLVAITVSVIQGFITPQLIHNESQLIQNRLTVMAEPIQEQMNRVQAQQKTITELVPALDNEQIDQLQPYLVNQYGDTNVFGGGIWPLPKQRDPARDKYSTFYARDASGTLQVNTIWNQAKSDNYWEAPWYKDGMAMPKGQCAWAKAYQDSASPEPRTNCAMAIYRQDKIWGVATIDVTLGFFNRLAQQMGEAIHGTVLIVESDGKVVGNAALIAGDAKLQQLDDTGLPMAAPLQALLKSNGGTVETQYDGADGSHTVFLQTIAGSPWSVASDVPTALLTQQSNTILSRLGMVQIPLAIILLLLILGLIRKLMLSLKVLENNIESLASGGADLTQRLPASSSPEFNAVAERFNQFIAFLQGLMRQVGDSAQSITTASREIARGNLDLASRTEEQAASIVETAASMEELTSTVRQNADNAQHANQLSSNASATAQRGTEVVDQVVTTMNDISASSDKMAEIIGVIDSIAFQTNILALNAAVEAARAGEQGRGFAVVAAEVRALAQRSANSAHEIRTLIETSTSKVQTGSALVQQAGATMGDLVKEVNNVTTLMAEIMSASREQTAGIEQTNTAIGQIDLTTQQNAALVEEVSAAAQSMEGQVTQLEQVVNSFKL